jgi:hypothetical protein
VAYLKDYGARFDPKARADEATLRATLAKLKIKPWPVLFEIERDFGGLCFADWILGPYAIVKKAPRLKNTRAEPVLLVCVGVNDTGRLLVDESGQIWDADAAAGSVRLRADSMERRIEREAYGSQIDVLRQHSYKILPSTVSAAAGAKRLGLPLIEKPSDKHESVWQSDELTVWKSTDDVRVFAKTDAALEKAVAAFGSSAG